MDNESVVVRSGKGGGFKLEGGVNFIREKEKKKI